MICGNALKSCKVRSAQTAYNDADQAFVATGTPITILGTMATDTGVAIDTRPTVFDINASGIYRISYDVDLTADGAGVVTLQLYDGTTALPCSVAARTVATDLEYAIHVETILALATCRAVNHAIGARIGGVAGTVTHVCASCVKLG